MKTQKHLPIFGVGPIYVFTIAVQAALMFLALVKTGRRAN